MESASRLLKSIPQRVNKPLHSTYKLKDFIDKDDDFIKTSTTGTILVDIKTITNNLDLLKRIISIRKFEQVNCADYESALFLEKYLDEKVRISLIDDYQNKDRSYVDTTKFAKHDFYIPLSYFMWGVKFDDNCNVHCLRYISSDTMTSMNGDKVLYQATLEKLKTILSEINNPNLSDLDKYVIVSNYLQSKVQYTEDGLESHADRVYIIDAKEDEVTREKVGSVRSVLNENYGLCIAIANTTTLLLNNPIMNVNVRSIFGDSHAWNLAELDGKRYYIDNTWAITRNPNRVKEALKATSFSDQYLLFGEQTAKSIGHHNSICYIDKPLETDDYSKETIEERVKVLSLKYQFTQYDQTLRFGSKIK